jgi:hypothetical protein
MKEGSFVAYVAVLIIFAFAFGFLLAWKSTSSRGNGYKQELDQCEQQLDIRDRDLKIYKDTVEDMHRLNGYVFDNCDCEESWK